MRESEKSVNSARNMTDNEQTQVVTKNSEAPAPLEDDDLEWEEWNPSRISFVHHMIAGSAAGLAEHTWNCVSRMVQNEGPLRLWRGVSATFSGCIPAHAAYFSIFEASKRLTQRDVTSHQPLRAAACGVTASLAHDLIMTPFDVCKQRMQLGYHESMMHCLRHIVRTEGYRSLYVSLPMTIGMNVPYGAVMVSVNESVKTMLNPTGAFSTQTSMIAGAIAGAVAAAVTNPLDVIKTRLQTQSLSPAVSVDGAAGGPVAGGECYYYQQIRVDSSRGGAATVQTLVTPTPPPFEGVRATFTRILREEGWRALGRGVVARMLTQSPAVAISWTTYETLKDMLQAK
eukprot:gene35400-42909_t